MKLTLTATTFLALMFANCSTDKLQEAVRRDFANKMSGYQIISANRGEGDAAVVSMQIKFKDLQTGAVRDTEWQYWDLKRGWTHIDEFLKIKEFESKANSNE